ncbi:hypothetical protein HMSP1_39 [Sinorhizobium phage HMSP1-Susan]|nr:hypothetical protein HMSP1_39 [Sinorhizobium phage HMSP1-Susan]
MSKSSEIILEWADDKYLFALRGKEIEELQSVCDAPFGAIFQRVMLGAWKFGDLKHTVRLGLMGGGMGAVEAARLTRMYMGDDKPCVPLAAGPNSPESVAKAILQVVMFGVDKLPQTGE